MVKLKIDHATVCVNDKFFQQSVCLPIGCLKCNTIDEGNQGGNQTYGLSSDFPLVGFHFQFKLIYIYGIFSIRCGWETAPTGREEFYETSGEGGVWEGSSAVGNADRIWARTPQNRTYRAPFPVTGGDPGMKTGPKNGTTEQLCLPQEF